MRKNLSDRGVAGLKPRAKRYSYPDPQQPGLLIRIQPSGRKSFCVVTLSPEGRQVWATLGPTTLIGIAEARERAREAIKRVRAGLPPSEPPAARPATFEAIAEQWLARHVRAHGLRSGGEIERVLRSTIYPAWAGRAFAGIRHRRVPQAALEARGR